MMTSYSKIRLQVSVLRTNGPLVHYVQRLANVTKFAKFNLHSIDMIRN